MAELEKYFKEMEKRLEEEARFTETECRRRNQLLTGLLLEARKQREMLGLI